MNLQEANQKIDSLKHLIDKKVGDNEISFFVISPKKADILGEIMKRIIYEESYDDLLYPFDDFNILVVLDYDNFIANGWLVWDHLDNTLEKIKKQH